LGLEAPAKTKKMGSYYRAKRTKAARLLRAAFLNGGRSIILN